MQQAIEEEFIVDVLGQYTTYIPILQTAQGRGRDPDYETKEANKKAALHEGHEFAIAEKAKIMIDHFQRDASPPDQRPGQSR